MLRDPLRKVATLRIRGWGPEWIQCHHAHCPPRPFRIARVHDNTLRDSLPSALLPSASSVEALEKSPDPRHLKLLIERLDVQAFVYSVEIIAWQRW